MGLSLCGQEHHHVVGARSIHRRNAPGDVPAIGASARVAPQHCPILSPDDPYCLLNEVKVKSPHERSPSDCVAVLFCPVVEFVIDGDVLVHQRQAAIEREGDLGGVHTLLKAMTDTIEFAEIVINRFERVMSFTGNLILRFAFGISLPADDAFVRQAGPDIMQSCPARDDLLLLALVCSDD